MTKKHNINIIADSALGHGKYTVARRIKELIENDEKLKIFNVAVKVTPIPGFNTSVSLKKELENCSNG